MQTNVLELNAKVTANSLCIQTRKSLNSHQRKPKSAELNKSLEIYELFSSDHVVISPTFFCGGYPGFDRT